MSTRPKPSDMVARLGGVARGAPPPPPRPARQPQKRAQSKAPSGALDGLHARPERMTSMLIRVNGRQRTWLEELRRQGYTSSEVIRHLLDYAMAQSPDQAAADGFDQPDLDSRTYES